MLNTPVALSDEQLQRYVPSAFAAKPYFNRSEQYAFIPTSSVIAGMRAAGFVPTRATQSRSRIEGKSEFTKHMIRFRAENQLAQRAVVGEQILEAVLINSHDGSSAYKLMCGVFRFVCGNGMVVADSLLESIHIRHQGNVIEQVVSGSERIIEQAPKVMDVIKQWTALPLVRDEQLALAEAAHTVRFDVDKETGKSKTRITPEMLLTPRRNEDQGNDLWRTFNRIQENTTKGMRAYSRLDGRVTSRAVKGIDGDVKLNRALWSLAEKMAELKGAAA